ncbi:hypothetical protein ABQJ54_11905 [Rhodanobacter sp. Si-c]|uniref:Transmembrane protein n=1 Tax=Rhodanobacter lycopersici TaxID=3162487 RepID=A0ABV3QG45_9GAMM
MASPPAGYRIVPALFRLWQIPFVRWFRSLLAVALAAGITLLAAWLLMMWSGAGAPSLPDFTQRHPMMGIAFGLLSTLIAVVSALLQRRRRKLR